MWPTYVLGVLAAAGLWLLVLFFFGTRGGMMRGERAPVKSASLARRQK
jgi:hypothetical protein